MITTYREDKSFILFFKGIARSILPGDHTTLRCSVSTSRTDFVRPVGCQGWRNTYSTHTHTQCLPFDNLFWVGGPTGLPTAFARGGQYPSMCIMQNDYCLMILNIDQFPIFDYYTQMSLMSYYVLLCSDPRYRRTRPTRRPA